ncbi:putative glucan 1 3-beta-glucosidase D [Ceratocystis platani]|uniref:glucan 1,3-beta-glucosidase n=1 Tax=Ceratocystis fimbriata f. sp. platani TaxID=88771 RepID=A0A0F8B118_CERFI|nr:putative glucan 1 3-beta-glucosidase D [Ceratocystis platani]
MNLQVQVCDKLRYHVIPSWLAETAGGIENEAMTVNGKLCAVEETLADIEAVPVIPTGTLAIASRTDAEIENARQDGKIDSKPASVGTVPEIQKADGHHARANRETLNGGGPVQANHEIRSTVGIGQGIPASEQGNPGSCVSTQQNRENGQGETVLGIPKTTDETLVIGRACESFPNASRPVAALELDTESEDELAAANAAAETRGLNRTRLIIGIVSAVLLIIIIVVAVVVSNNNNGNSSSSSNRPSSSTNSQGRSQVPTAEKNTDMDPWSWYDTTDFNMTYTNVMVGDLPIIGLYSDWDDSAQANSKVPALDKEWGSYSTRPARGVNLGGWLSLEPFITPSLFSYSSANGIIDEYTLTSKLGGSAKGTLEKHYATFITESDFKAIADAGLDHVRIPFSYWAIEVYDDEPYLHRTSWRYLLRGLEWARKYGLRVNLDVHGLPGSQNGWNHSGRQGAINWLNGINGATNAQRSLDIHDRLSKFFAQDRYKNLIAFYGLANEPRMTALSASAVVNWTEAAYKIVQGNGIQAPLVFGDGFMGLENWKGVMTGYGDSLILDVHQYVIFDENLIVFTHTDKIKYACNTWTSQAQKSSDTSTGFGPTMFAEWSQADTDCARHLTNVGWGNRWEGTYDTGVESTSTLSPSCPAKDSSCRCTKANADASDWNSAYKDFLKDFAEAQMHSFERGRGWWYWTWKTESAPQWSYQAGLAAGVLPAKAYERDFDCSNLPTSYPGLDENY